MKATKVPVPTTEALTAAFRAAREAAEAANTGDDEGTCNFDTAVLWLSHRYQKRVADAAEAAGITFYARKWCGSAFFLHAPSTGHWQGNRNTRIAEAMCKALETHGLDAGMYYQMD